MKIHEGTKLHASVVRRRQILAICLLPMLATWCFLIVRITSMEVVWNALPNPEITFRRLNFPNNWEQFLTLNPRTGRLYVVEEPPLAMDKNFSLRALRTYTNKDGVPQRRWKLSVRNPPSFKIDRVREFDYSPYRDYPPPVVVAQRFVVSSKRNKWAVTDLDSQDRTAFEHPALAGGVDEFSHCYSIANTNNFVYLNYHSQPKTNTPVSQIRIELFGIRASGVPHLINSWFVATKGVTAFLLYDDQLVSINPIERHFEFRSASDGKLISIKALPPDLDLTIDRFDFMGGNLLVNNANRAFSFEKLRWLKTPIGTRYFGESPDKKLQLWRDDHEWVVTDGESERELARIGRGSYALFIDNETVMQFSNSWGFTCCTVAARTGTTIMSWRPNWWAFPLLLFTVPAYVVWSFLWLKTVSESSRNAWWDIALIAGLPIVAFSIRFAFVGQSYDLNRYPSHLIFGIFLAVAFVASVWLWSSQQNIVLRCLPLLWSLIAIANVLVFVFAQRSSYSDESRVAFKEFFLLAVLVPVFAICFLFRLGGFRLNRDTHFSNSKMFTCSLKDLLIIVATCALLFSPLRSIELEVLMMEADQADFALWPYILIAAFSPCVAWFLAMSKNRFFFWLAFVFRFWPSRGSSSMCSMPLSKDRISKSTEIGSIPYTITLVLIGRIRFWLSGTRCFAYRPRRLFRLFCWLTYFVTVAGVGIAHQGECDQVCEVLADQLNRKLKAFQFEWTVSTESKARNGQRAMHLHRLHGIEGISCVAEYRWGSKNL